jgi:uncharacterized protein YwqG
VNLLNDEKFDRIRQKVLPLRRETVWLLSSPTSNKVQTGKSKLGGFPDVIPNFEWPTTEGRPLAFLGQLNTNEVRSVLPDSLPEERLLLFFYDSIEQPDGLNGRSGWLVLSLPLQLGLSTCTSVVPEQVFLEESIQMVAAPSFPDASAEIVRDFQSNIELYNIYIEFLDSIDKKHLIDPNRRRHKLFGYPDLMQGDVFLEADWATHPENKKEDEDFTEEDAARITSTWMLLAQFDSLFYAQSPSHKPGASADWGDGGKLYFCLEGTATSDDDIEKAWIIRQS